MTISSIAFSAGSPTAVGDDIDVSLSVTGNATSDQVFIALLDSTYSLVTSFTASPNQTGTYTVTHQFANVANGEYRIAAYAQTFGGSPNSGFGPASGTLSIPSATPTVWSKTAGPSWASVDPVDGEITWTSPPATGSFTVDRTASNSCPLDLTQTVTIVVAAASGVAPTFTSASPTITLTQGTAGTVPAPTVTGTTPITYSLSGTVPAGVTINSTTGVITFPTTVSAGSGTFQRVASNGTLPNASQTVTWTVNAASVVGQIVGPLTAITAGTPSSQTLSTTGGVTNIQLLSNLPAWAGLTLIGGNFILQTNAPVGTTSPQNITFNVTNANGTVQQTLPIVVNAATPLNIQGTFTFTGVHGSPVTGTATAVGGTPPYTFSLLSADANTTGYVTVNANGTWTLSGSVP